MSKFGIVSIGVACFVSGYVAAFVAMTFLSGSPTSGLFLRIEFEDSSKVVSLYQSYICSQDSLTLKKNIGLTSSCSKDGSLQTVFIPLTENHCLTDVFETANRGVDKFDLRSSLISIGITTRKR